jgi:hypothetical protein
MKYQVGWRPDGDVELFATMCSDQTERHVDLS